MRRHLAWRAVCRVAGGSCVDRDHIVDLRSLQCDQNMAPKPFLGEFEQMVLLAILQKRGDAFGLVVRRELEASAGRQVSRGAFYTTLDRMEAKGYVRWKTAHPHADGGGMPQRLFRVTPAGIRALRASRKALVALWRGLDDILEA